MNPTLKARWKSTSLSNKAIVVLTAFLTVSTIALTGFNYWQICIYKQAIHLENRPYLTVEIDPPMNVEVGKIPFVRWRILNVGKTPAQHVDYLTSFRLGNPPTISEINIGDTMKIPLGAGFIIGNTPYQGDDARWEKPITEQEMTWMERDSIQLSFWGDIIYEDESNRSHRTRFFVRYVPKSKMMKPLPIHNDMDDDE